MKRPPKETAVLESNHFQEPKQPKQETKKTSSD
jgi:hypothetical protein